MKKTTVIIGVIVALAAACIALVLTGAVQLPASCSSALPISGGQAPAAAPVGKSVKVVSEASEENMRSLFGNAYDRLVNAEIDPAPIYKALLGGVTVDVPSGSLPEGADVASCTANITNVDVAEVVSRYQAAVSSWATTDDALEVMSSDNDGDLLRKEVELFLEAAGASDVPTKTSSATLSLVIGEDGEWTVEDPAQVIATALAGYDAEALF